MAPSETFSQRVTRFDTEFTDKLIGFLNKIHYIAEKNQSEKFINLIHRSVTQFYILYSSFNYKLNNPFLFAESTSILSILLNWYPYVLKNKQLNYS